MALDEKYPLALPQGTILAGQYTIERALGQGGFGITYQAKDHKTGQSVAVKEFFPDSMAARTTQTAVTAFSGERGESFTYGKKCFLQEAETLAEFIGNENIVRVYSYFEENGTAYFVMEFIEGTSFDQYIKDHGGKVPYEEAEKILLPVIDALAAVHAKGIVHRDVTPDNIYITKDGRVKLLDFGAARYSLGDKSRSLDIVLKHGFAPREQYTRHGRQGPYTDVYTVGASFYFAITGRRPPDSIDRIDEDELIPPSSLGVKIAPNKEDAILMAMSVQPSNRYQTMGEFRQALMGAAGAQAGMSQASASSQVQQRVFTAPQPTPVPRSAEPQPIHIPQQPQSVGQQSIPRSMSVPPQPMPAQSNMGQQSMQAPPMRSQQPMRSPQPMPAQPNMGQQSIPRSMTVPPQPMRSPQPMPAQPNMGQQSIPRSMSVPQQSMQAPPMRSQQPMPQSMPMQPQGEERKKKKWLLPAGIGAGIVLAVVAIIVIVIPRGGSKKEAAHYELEQDIVSIPGGNGSTLPPEPDNGSGNGIANSGAFSNEAANIARPREIRGNLPENIVNNAYLVWDNSGIACWYPGVGLVWGGSDGNYVYDSTTGVIQSISIVDGVIYYVDADQRACRVGTDGEGIAYMAEANGYEILKLWAATDGFYFVTTDYCLYYCKPGSSPSCSAELYDGPVFYDGDIYYVPIHDPQGLYRIKNVSDIGANGTGELVCRINAGDITMQTADGTSDVRGDGSICPYVAADGYLYAVYSETGHGATTWEAILQIRLSDGCLSDTMINPAIEGGHITSVNEQDGYLYFANYNELTQESSVERCLTSCFQTGTGTIDTVWEGESRYLASVSVLPNESKIAFYRVDPESYRQIVVMNVNGSGEPTIFSEED